jgi:hypothetical protein
MASPAKGPPPPAPQVLTEETPAISDWPPPVEWLNDLGGSLPSPIEFTDRDIRLIVHSLPRDVDQKRVEMLPFLLREWAQVDLRWHFVGTPLPVLARQRKGMAKIAKQAALLIEALDALDGFGRWKLVELVGVVEGLAEGAIFRNEANKRKVEEWRRLTTTIATAAGLPQPKPRKGQPRNEVAALVLMDLAALFGYVTGKRPARDVPRTGEDAHKESGPFLEFARAVWPVIFQKGDFGLLSQLREWADHGSNWSMLMSGIALRRPEWGVIPTR